MRNDRQILPYQVDEPELALQSAWLLHFELLANLVLFTLSTTAYVLAP